MSRRVVIVGAGSLGRELRQYIDLSGSSKEIVFLDDSQPNNAILPVIGGTFDIENTLSSSDVVFIACASPSGRRKICERLHEQTCYPDRYVHSSAIGSEAHHALGLMMMPYALMSAGARVGQCLLLNTYASVGHDVIVGNYVTLCSHATLTGRVVLGDGVFIGTGAIVCPDIKIGENAYIGAGAVVIKDVPANGRVFGNPARSIQ
jgi:sugar O-acyltransferase (sialic acid O-acetyltransferase NeuD family)